MKKKLLRCCLGLALPAFFALPASLWAQGGETCATATIIAALPYCDAGSTVGHVNDYAPPCVTGVAAPDVVYSYTPAVTQAITVSLCFSLYNTALHVWRGCPLAGGVNICCSDNLCGLQSCCNSLVLVGGITYYFIVDGSNFGGGAVAGNYLITVVPGTQCPTQPCDTNLCPYPDRDIDPINDVCTGNIPILACEDTVCGMISPTTDRDWYAIDIPAPNCARLTLDVYANDTPGWFPFGMGLNPRVWLVRPDCLTILGMDDDSGIGEDSRLVSECLDPGRYLIMVENASATQPAGPYILRTSCVPCTCACPYPDGDVEPNSTCATAGPALSCPDTVCGLIANANDGDYYQFVVPTGSCMIARIDVFGNDTPGFWPFGQGLNPQFCLYDAACSGAIGCALVGGVGNDPRLISPCLPAGTYKIRVSGEGGTFGPYILALACQPCQCPADTCPYPDLDFEPVNDACAANIPGFTCPDTLCGEIDNIADEDWYRVQLVNTPCTQITIDVFGNDTPGWWPVGQGLNPVVSLWSNCGTQIGIDDNSGIGNDSRLVSGCLPPGTYFIRIFSTGAVAPTMGPYVLLTTCTPCQCGGCDLSCPPNGIAEGEPCPNVPDNFNSGCLHTPPVFRPIQCGNIICGTSFASAAGGRDTDWYLLNLTTRDSVYWCATAEFRFDIAIWDLNAGCPGDSFVHASADTCDTVCVSACLEPGVYAMYIAPSLGTIVSCPAAYVAWLICRPCEADTCPFPSRDFEAINNTCETFNPQLQCNDTLCGEIRPLGDLDWYLLQVPNPCAVVTIDVFGDDTPGLWPFGRGLNPRVSLVSLDCSTFLAFDLNSGVGEDPRLTSACLTGGLYHVMVQGEGIGAPTQGPYIITVRCEPCNCTPCDIHCVNGDVLENEPCPNVPDNFNSGCDGPPPPETRPINCGQTVCGRLWSDSSRYDTDWWLLRTNENDTLMWCVWSEVPVITYIFATGPGPNPCIGLDTLACRRSGVCDTICIGACVPPGFYAFKVEPVVGALPYPAIPCSTTYRARLLCTICSPVIPESPDSVVIYFPTIANPDIHLHWPPVPGAEAYNVYRHRFTGTPPSPLSYVATTADTFYYDLGITASANDSINIYTITTVRNRHACP